MDRAGGVSGGKVGWQAAGRPRLVVWVAAAVTVLFVSVGEAAAPSIPLPYHNGATLICSDCHTMHYSQQHDFGGAAGQGLPSLAGGPTGKLLRRATSTQVCLACHDGRSGIPDVMKGDTNGLGDNRAGGYFSEDPGTLTYKGHNLTTDDNISNCMRCHDFSLPGPPADGGLRCIECHNPHGNAAYRNIQRRAHNSPPNQPKAIAFTDATGINKYDQNHIAYSAPPTGDNTWREITYLCSGSAAGGCHGEFASNAGGTNTGNTSPFHRHPGTNSQEGVYFPINRAGANTDPAHWAAGTGSGFSVPRVPFVVRGATDYSLATVVAENNEVFCLSCHKAHGSGNAFSMRWAYGSGAPGTNQAGCQQCHNK
jgi:hypothetical protein